MFTFPSHLKKSYLLVSFIFLIFLCCTGCGNATVTPTVKQFFSEAPPLDKGGPVDPAVIRDRAVYLNIALLPADTDRLTSNNARLELNLFEDETLVGIIERVEKNNSGGLNYIGRIEGEEGSLFILVLQEQQLAASIRIQNRIYTIRYTGGEDVHAIVEFDQTKMPGDAEPIIVKNPSETRTPKSGGATADDGSIIDVMVVYTENAKIAAGGLVGMQNHINLAVAEANITYENSDITQRLNLIHTGEVNYISTGDDEIDLENLYDPNDFIMDEVQVWRETYYADIVTLFADYDVSVTRVCGRGFQMFTVDHSFESHAYNVVDLQCASSMLTYTHELGHNMGAHHDWYVDQSTRPYDYAHGYVNLTEGWRTLMAYDDACDDAGVPCHFTPFWSNPDIDYAGDPMGIPHADPEPADNAEVLDNTAYTVANFRVRGTIYGDIYELDDTFPKAKWIESHVPQVHSIYPVQDLDHVKFELTEESGITLAVSATSSSTTAIYLYDQNLSLIEMNDSSGLNGNGMI